MLNDIGSVPFVSRLRRLIDMKPGEGHAVAWAWLYIFSLLLAYYILRPIRDQMGVAGGVDNLQWLFSGTLIGMLVLNLPFSWLVKAMPRQRFITISYRFFAANILMFAAALHFATPAQEVWIGRAFFIWTSIFNLFAVSIFWQLIVDTFSTEQGKRLFGFIAAGTTIGAIFGSAFMVAAVNYLSPAALMIGAALLLEIAILCVRRLCAATMHRQSVDEADPRSLDKPVGGTVLAGFRAALSSSYLLNVSLFLLLFAVTTTFLYFQQATIVSTALESREEQTQFFASVDLAVNILTLGIQLFLTSRILKKFGVGPTLSMLPGASILGFGVIALIPSLACVVGFQLLRRAGNFAVARPTRELLFTVVPREDRYKAKSFIDTVIYRLGDQIGAWAFALLSSLHLGATVIATIASGLSALWLVNGWWLGRRHHSLADGEVDGEVAHGVGQHKLAEA